MTPARTSDIAADTELVVAHTSSGAEVLAEKVSGAQVIAAFNTVPSEVLFDVFQARDNAARQAWCTAAITTAANVWRRH